MYLIYILLEFWDCVIQMNLSTNDTLKKGTTSSIYQKTENKE